MQVLVQKINFVPTFFMMDWNCGCHSFDACAKMSGCMCVMELVHLV